MTKTIYPLTGKVVFTAKDGSEHPTRELQVLHDKNLKDSKISHDHEDIKT